MSNQVKPLLANIVEKSFRLVADQVFGYNVFSMKTKQKKPGRKRRQMVPIDQGQYDLLKELADEGNRPVTYELRQAINNHLKNQGKTPSAEA